MDNKTNIIDLTKTTFIIPVCIESSDRYNNAKTVLGYLNKNFKTNIIIHELTKEHSGLDFLESLNNLKINHIIQKDSRPDESSWHAVIHNSKSDTTPYVC